MASSGLLSGTEPTASAWSTIRSTVGSISGVGRPAVRTWRRASARTCQTFQCARRACTSVNAAAAVLATQASSTSMTLGRCACGIRVSIRASPSSPSTSTASACHCVNCSARLRGAFFASRVSRVACWARSRASTSLGGRAWVVWKRAASLLLAGLDHQAPARPALREALIHPRDLTRRPLAQVAVRPLGEHQPRPVGQVLLQAGVVGLRRAHRGRIQDPPVDRQPAPVQGLDLVGHRQVGVQVRVAGAGVAVDERSRDRTAHVDLAHPVAAGAGEQRVAFEVGQGVGHRLVVGGLDLVPDCGRGDRPQRRHALGGGERQVVAGHRGRARAGVPGDRCADLTGVGRVTAVLGPKQAAGNLGADAGPLVDVDRVVTGQAGRHVVLLEPARHLTTEQRHILGGGVHLERRAQAHRRPPLRLGRIRAQRFEPFGGQRVVA